MDFNLMVVFGIGEESPLQARHVNQTIKHGGGAIFVWDCMTSCGISYMCKIERKMKQELYLNILKDELMDTIKLYHFNPPHVIFQLDNDPQHTSKSIKHCLSMQDFDVLIWPPQSHDLNPIEHVDHQPRECLNYRHMCKVLLILSLLHNVKSSIRACPTTSKLFKLPREGGQIINMSIDVGYKIESMYIVYLNHYLFLYSFAIGMKF